MSSRVEILEMRTLLWLILLWVAACPALCAAESLEQAVVAEVNLLRTQPRTYAQFIRDERKYFVGLVHSHPGRRQIRTHEGLAAYEEAADFLDRQAPVGPLEGSLGLSLGALDHAKDQGRSGKTGHEGADHSFVQQRVARYGQVNGCGENIMYGADTARDIVLKLVVDDGVSDRGHRLNFFRPDYTRVGVACGPHPTYRSVCVIALAMQYSEDPQLQAGHRAPSTSENSTWNASPGGRPTRTPSAGTPLQQARAAAEAHYRACLNQDRSAWLATFTPSQRAYAPGFWRQAQETSVGATYTYGCIEKTSPLQSKFRYLRNTGGKITPCFITMILDSGAWRVDEVTY